MIYFAGSRMMAYRLLVALLIFFYNPTTSASDASYDLTERLKYFANERLGVQKMQVSFAHTQCMHWDS